MKKKACSFNYPMAIFRYFGIGICLLIFSQKNCIAQDASYIIGSGYDITTHYADISHCKESLFDIRNEGSSIFLMANNQKHNIEVRATPATSYIEIFGRSLEEYMTSFGNKTSISGSYGPFSASVSVDFNLNKSGSMQNDFMTIQHYVDLKMLRLPYEVKKLVKPSVQKAIDDVNISPEVLFDRFGTHYIWEAPIGGRADFIFQFDRQQSSQQFNLEVAARVEYNSLASSGSVSNETSYGKNSAQLKENAYYNIKTYGGDSNKGARIRQDRQNGMKEWATSVRNNPTLSRFTKNSLRPISDLCSTEERKQQIKVAFDNYAKGNSILNQPPKLDVRIERNLVKVATDEGSGADDDVSIFKAVANNGYYILGHKAENHHKAAQGSTIIVKDISGSKNSLAKPISWREVWGDWGSGGDDDWTIWCPICPTGFVALGYVAYNKYKLPSGPGAIFSGHPFSDVRCVNEKLATPASTGTSIYDDQGSGADHDVRIYPIKNGRENHYDGGYFYAQKNYDSPSPNPPLYMLKKPAEVPAPKRELPKQPEKKIAPVVLEVDKPVATTTNGNTTTSTSDNITTANTTTTTTTATTSADLDFEVDDNFIENDVLANGDEIVDSTIDTDNSNIIETTELSILCTDYYKMVYQSGGTNSNEPLSIWNPDGKEGFKPLGHVAIAKWDTPEMPAAMVKAKTPDAVAYPLDYRQIWVDQGSGGNMDVSLWEPIAPEGYVALGTIAVASYEKPDLKAVVCVRKDLTVATKVGTSLWNDAGSGADRDCGLWSIDKGIGEVLPSGSFCGAASHAAPGSSAVTYVLKLD